MNNISIRHLRAFVEIANLASFTRAARQLNVTQSTLTATIKQLEQQAGLILFDRTTRQVTLTKEGQRFFPVAKRLITDFRLAIDDLQAGAEQQRGHIIISTSPTGNSILVPELIKRYNTAHPKIDISIYEAGASEIEQQVLSKFADFGIGGNHTQDAQLEYQPILQDQYGAIMTCDHPLAGANSLTWRQLRGQKMLHLSQDNGIRSELEQLNKQNIIHYQSSIPTIEASNPNGLGALIRKKVGIAVLPALASQVLAFAGLKFVPLITPVRARELYIVRRKDYTLSPGAVNMLKILGQILQQQAGEAHQFVTYTVPQETADDK
ncbi:MAG: LysR family transcriptional regulator [Pseudomonadales bacterium]|nr:LysR family transcriptional regulator [Pseudomonadales bacterium]NRA17779.1 LysR family transcriptional regulator [Oceanospirillaceae bacterium]